MFFYKRLTMTLSLLFFFTAVAAPGRDITHWRQKWEPDPSTLDPATPSVSLSEIDKIRLEGDIERARILILEAVARSPEDPEVLWRSSRAESDAVYLFHHEDKTVRDDAAASALDYARRAKDQGADSPAAWAQLCWAMGNATHLQPMFERSNHARKTLAYINTATTRDPDNPTVFATSALLQYRLATLPTMAKIMARSAPKGTLPKAQEYAQKAYDKEPSRLHASILAKSLIKQKLYQQAKDLLIESLAKKNQFPRDEQLIDELNTLLEEANKELE